MINIKGSTYCSTDEGLEFASIIHDGGGDSADLDKCSSDARPITR